MRAMEKRGQALPYVQETAERISEVLDSGKRAQAVSQTGSGDDLEDGQGYRVRGGPTRSERLNRALVELSPSAFKVHTLLWKWRGAPARGLLPFFTIHSLSKFCNLTRPTVRSGLVELVRKGWIQRLGYNCHVKNALYRLVPIRKVPIFPKEHSD